MSGEAFDKAAEQVKHLKQRPSDTELLELYGLYKQATVGDNSTTRPGLFDPKGKAKWDAWDKVKGMSKETAVSKYCELSDSLVAKYGLA